MVRLPYDIVVIEADRLIIKMALAADWERSIYYWEQYLAYIEACGWTDYEFDKETLKRIDAAWISIKRRN